jgi:hypothetical protein
MTTATFLLRFRHVSASGALRSQVCTLSLSLRGRPASQHSLSQLRHGAPVRAALPVHEACTLPEKGDRGEVV